VQLKNEIESFNELFNTVSLLYSGNGRKALIFESKFPDEDEDVGYFVRFLLDRKHVVEYRIAKDRGFFLSILSMAIGPHYFTVADVFDYDSLQRFELAASTEAVIHNLKLLDEFLEPD
jgi:hypothetical protein